MQVGAIRMVANSLDVAPMERGICLRCVSIIIAVSSESLYHVRRFCFVFLI